MPTELTTTERRQLADCERRIRAGLKTFQEVGSALLEIQGSRLYRQEYKTFEAYCRDKWQLPKRTAYHYIDQAKAINSVPSLAQSGASAAAIEELSKLPADQRADAWQDITERLGDNPTAEEVAHEVYMMRHDDDPPESHQTRQDATDDEDASEGEEAVEDAGDAATANETTFKDVLAEAIWNVWESHPEVPAVALADLLRDIAVDVEKE